MKLDLPEILERCRELQGPWLAKHGEDFQQSLLTAEEIRDTVGESSESGKTPEGRQEASGGILTTAAGILQLLRETNVQVDFIPVGQPTHASQGSEGVMLPALTNCDPGDETTEPISRTKVKGDCRVCGGDGWLPSLPEGNSNCPACGGSGRELL